MPPEINYFTIGVLGKAFAVIELMTQKTHWGLSELSAASALPKGTLQRILLTLCELGYVWQENKGGTYSLTLKIFKFGRRVVSNHTIVDQTRPACRALLETVNETVNLCMPLCTDMVVVSQQVSTQALRLDSISSSSFPIYRSASGKTYAAFLDDATRQQLIHDIHTKHQDISEKEIQQWCKELDLTRIDGISFDYEEIFVGVRCLAAPIFDYTGAVIATIGCSIPTVRITAATSETFIREVSKTAKQISQILGAPKHEFATSIRSMLDCPMR